MNKPIRGNPTNDHNFPKRAVNSNNGLYNEWVEGQYYNGFYCGGDYFIGQEKNLSLENDGLCLSDTYENAHRNTAVRKSQSTAGGGGAGEGEGDKPTPKEAPKPIKEFDENYKSDEYRQPKDGNGYTEDAYTVAQKFIDRTQFPLG